MKVLYFAKGLTSLRGGSQLAASRLLSAIEGSIELAVLTDRIDFRRTTQKKQYPIYSYLSRFGLSEIPGLSFEVENFLAEVQMRRICRLFRPDLVHIHGYAGYYPRPHADVPSLLTFHDFPPTRIFDSYSSGPLKYLEFLWWKRASQIRLRCIHKFTHYHALSTRIARFLVTKGIRFENIFVIPNGTDMTSIYEESQNSKRERQRSVLLRILGLEPDTKLIIMLGSIEYNKGIHRVVEALRYLPPNFHLILIGSHAPLIGCQYLRALLRNPQKSRIHHLGKVDHSKIYPLLSLADCYVSSSISEACQLTPIEAVMANVPVVLNRVGAAEDLFGVDYPLFFSETSTSDLAEKILQAVNSQSKLRNSSSYCTFLSWKQVGKLIVEAYHKICNS